MILLGICTTFKADLECTTAYVTTLRLPTEFFKHHTDATIEDLESFLTMQIT